MKLNGSILFAAAFGIALIQSLPASAQDGRFYARADAGGTVTEDVRLKEYFGEALAPGSEVKFEPGGRFNFAGGFWVTPWFGVEAETGIMVNYIDSITGAADVDDASLSNIPFLINLRFQCPKEHVVAPFIGVGIGGSASVIDADRILINGTSMSGNQTAGVFAYQAFAGLRFRLNDNMGLSLEYHYFGTTDPEWDADFVFGTGSDEIRFDGAETHSLSLAFDFQF